MKHSFFLFALITSFLFSTAQDSAKESKLKEEKIFSQVEQEPSFPGGEAEWKNFLEKNIEADAAAAKGAPAGTYTVITRFVVDKDGNVSNVSAKTNNGYGMEDEAIKAIKQSGKWTPAKQNGRQVNAYHEKAIVFEVPAKGPSR
jgi:protein TonB